MISMKQDKQRQRLAEQAAAWMLQSGLDYGAAKRRAQQRWRRDHPGEVAPLPDNDAIDSELRAHWSTFAPQQALERLRLMRQTARQLMRKFEEFRPLLGGACVHGALAPNSAIDLLLTPDDPKSLEIFCANESLDIVPWSATVPARKRGGNTPPGWGWDECWRLHWPLANDVPHADREWVPVRLLLFKVGNRRWRPQQSSERDALWTLAQLEAALQPTQSMPQSNDLDTVPNHDLNALAGPTLQTRL